MLMVASGCSALWVVPVAACASPEPVSCIPGDRGATGGAGRGGGGGPNVAVLFDNVVLDGRDVGSVDSFWFSTYVKKQIFVITLLHKDVKYSNHNYLANNNICYR